MKVNDKFIIIPLLLLSSSLAFADTPSVTTKIRDMRQMPDYHFVEQPSEIFINVILNNEPCDHFTLFAASPSSLGLDEQAFMVKIQEIASHAEKSDYFNVRTAQCNENADITLITNIETCNTQNCPDQYLLDNKVWLSSDFDIVPINEPMWIDYYYNLPLKWDEEKKLWEIKAYDAKNIYFSDVYEEQMPLAFITYSETDNPEIFTPFGKFIQYYSSGGIAVEKNYGKNGQEGEVKSYYQSGKLYQSANYIDGKPHGDVITYHENNSIESNIEYIDGKPRDGFCTHYFDDGKVSREHTYYEGAFDGKYIDYHPNGKIAQQSTYDKGSLVGQSKSYYLTGQIKSVDNFSNECKRDGEQISYYDNGQIDKKSFYQDAIKISEEYSNKSGILIRSSHWDQNRDEHGEQKEWHRDGQLKEHANYNHGVKVGEFKNWSADGDLIIFETYDDKGIPIGEHKYWNITDKKLYKKKIYNDQGVLMFTHNYYDSYKENIDLQEVIKDHQTDNQVTIYYDHSGNIISEE